MSRTSLIIDCDPGVDDAIALFLAFASPDELEILAVTTAAGNVDARQTARNARIIRQLAGREEIPVYAGAEDPLVRAPVIAAHFHGASGLGDFAVFEPAAPTAPKHAVNAIIDIVMSRPPGSVSVAVTGPMTNLALALRMEPALIRRLGTIVVMGGARSEGGNITASAEFNIHADPHAAAVVFASGLKCVVLGLDVTHQVRADPQRTAAIKATGTVAGRTVGELLDFSWGVQRRLANGLAPPMHDPCTIAYLLAPHLFVAQPAILRVETGSELTLGHTAVEFRVDPAAATVQWITSADADAVFALMIERFGRA